MRHTDDYEQRDVARWLLRVRVTVSRHETLERGMDVVPLCKRCEL